MTPHRPVQIFCLIRGDAHDTTRAAHRPAAGIPGGRARSSLTCRNASATGTGPHPGLLAEPAPNPRFAPVSGSKEPPLVFLQLVAIPVHGYDIEYGSDAPREDQPPFPTTLFVVDAGEVAETYVNTASRMTAMSLPILVSSRELLSYRGILGRSWRPLWNADRPPLALRELGHYGWDSLRQRMHRQETR